MCTHIVSVDSQGIEHLRLYKFSIQVYHENIEVKYLTELCASDLKIIPCRYC